MDVKVVGLNGKGDRNPVAKYFKEGQGVVYNGNRRSRM